MRMWSRCNGWNQHSKEPGTLVLIRESQSLLTEPASAWSKPGTVAHRGSDSKMALGTREQNWKQSATAEAVKFLETAGEEPS